MTVLRAWQTFIRVFLVCAVAGTAVPAWAESPYPREQVEQHLKTMFQRFELASLNKPVLAAKDSGFDFFVSKKRFRIHLAGFKKGEIPIAEKIIVPLFFDIIERPLQVPDPDENQFDIQIVFADDLFHDGMLPQNKQWLKSSREDEAAYQIKLKRANDEIVIISVSYARKDGDRFVVTATQRDQRRVSKEGILPFDDHLRLVLFRALTGAGPSDVINPSVVNWPVAPPSTSGFAPIDLAVLRAIFNHQDWSGKSYATKFQLLTDRVMVELTTNP